MRSYPEPYSTIPQFFLSLFIAWLCLFASVIHATDQSDESPQTFSEVFTASGFSSQPLIARVSSEKSPKANSSFDYRYHLLGANSEPLVVLLGGGPGFSSWNLEPVQQHIQRMGFQVLLMDMVGVGENKQNKLVTNSTNYIDLWIEQIHKVQQIVEKPTSNLILVGHSWGALMTMLYAREYPHQVSKMILLNPVDPEKKSLLHLTTEIDQRNRQQQLEIWDDELNWQQKTAVSKDEFDSITLKQIQQVLPTYFLDYELGRAYSQQFTVADFEIDVNVQAWKNYDENPVTYQQLADIDKPLYFLECQQDYLMPYNLDAFTDSIQLTQVELLDQCGHFPWVETPKSFYRVLSAFLSEETHNE